MSIDEKLKALLILPTTLLTLINRTREETDYCSYGEKKDETDDVINMIDSYMGVQVI